MFFSGLRAFQSFEEFLPIPAYTFSTSKLIFGKGALFYYSATTDFYFLLYLFYFLYFSRLLFQLGSEKIFFYKAFAWLLSSD